jgi:hypothetical protein
MDAAGMGKRSWATVRCSYCGGRGKVVAPDVEEEQPETDEAQGNETEAAETEPAKTE